jgi:hypothetical protein
METVILRSIEIIVPGDSSRWDPRSAHDHRTTTENADKGFIFTLRGPIDHQRCRNECGDLVLTNHGGQGGTSSQLCDLR